MQNSDEDLELEITDLPPGENGGKSALLLAWVTALFSSVHTWRKSKRPTIAVSRGEDAGNFELEILDLPREDARGISDSIIAWGNRFSFQARIWQMLLAGGVICLALMVIFSTFPSVRDTALSLLTMPTPTPTPQPQGSFNSFSQVQLNPQDDATAIVRTSDAPTPGSRPLDQAPQDCPASQFQSFGPPFFPAGLGEYPVWVTGFTGPPTRLAFLDATQPQPRRFGWAYHLLIIVKATYSGPLEITGGSLDTHIPLWFDNTPTAHSNNSNAPPTTELLLQPILDMQFVQHSGLRWRSFLTNIYVPAAGCYFLTASWDGGSWQVYFAAGR
jgi:hypothetical protein